MKPLHVSACGEDQRFDKRTIHHPPMLLSRKRTDSMANDNKRVTLGTVSRVN